MPRSEIPQTINILTHSPTLALSYAYNRASLVVQRVKRLPAIQETGV